MSRFKSLPHYLPAERTWARHSLRSSLHLINVGNNQFMELWQFIEKSSLHNARHKSRTPTNGAWMLLAILLTCLPFQWSELILEVLVFLMEWTILCWSRILLSVHSSCFLSGCLSSLIMWMFWVPSILFPCFWSWVVWASASLLRLELHPCQEASLVTLAKPFEVLYHADASFSTCLSDQNTTIQLRKKTAFASQMSEKDGNLKWWAETLGKRCLFLSLEKNIHY